LPVDEHKLIRDNSRAQKAKDLLENELLNEAIATLEADLIRAWKATPARDTEGRERCWTAVQQVGNLKGYLEAVMRDGQLAAAQLKSLAEKPKRFGIV
jgi:hypothetical protein